MKRDSSVVNEQEELLTSHLVPETWSTKCKIYLSKIFPILGWAPNYSLSKLLSDLIAGITVGFVVIPQALAYAKITGLPPQYGLYASYMGVIVYSLFGTSRDVTTGPTAIMSLLVGHAIKDAPTELERIQWAVALSLVCGGMQTIMGFLHLGVLVTFISRPVISGFISSSAIVIAVGQLHHLLGTPGSQQGFIQSVNYTFVNFGPAVSSHWPDLVLGASLTLLGFFLSYVGQKFGPITKIASWIAVGRNFIMVVVGTVLSYAFAETGVYFGNHTAESCHRGQPNFPCSPFKLTGPVPNGLNGTVSAPTIPFSVFANIGPSILLVALIGYLESISIAKGFARKGGYKVAPSQELIALGMANFVGSFFNAYPITGSFSRSAVNNAAGVKTPAAGIVTALLVIMAAELMTAALYWIPTVSLAAVIISSVIPMIEYHIVPHMWKTDKWELFILAVAFFACLFIGLEYGMLAAIAVSILYVLFRTARARTSQNILSINLRLFLLNPLGQRSSLLHETPTSEEDDSLNMKGTRAMVWCFEGPLLFFSSAYFSDKLAAFVSERREEFDTLVLDMRYVTLIDESGMNELEDSVKALIKIVDIRIINVQDRLFRAIQDTDFANFTGISPACISPMRN